MRNRQTLTIQKLPGELVVTVRHGDRACEKTRWCAANLPLPGAREYPVPAIVWQGLLDDDWHVVVRNRLPGRPVTSLRARRWAR